MVRSRGENPNLTDKGTCQSKDQSCGSPGPRCHREDEPCRVLARAQQSFWQFYLELGSGDIIFKSLENSFDNQASPWLAPVISTLESPRQEDCPQIRGHHGLHSEFHPVPGLGCEVRADLKKQNANEESFD